MPKREWAGNTYGTAFMHRWLIRALRHTDVRLWYAFTAVFVIPFCMIFAKGARTTYQYFRQRQGFGPLKSFRMTYVNLVLFSQVVIDKFAMFAGKKMKLKVENYDIFKNLAAKEEGFVILSAHVGCYEMAGYELVSDKKPFNALVFAHEKESVMKGRKSLFIGNHIKMIPIKSDMSHIFAIDNALANGEIVSIPADRMLGSTKSVEVNFLGTKAKLPMGPFSIAAMRGLNVIAVNVMKTSSTGYTAYIKQLDYDKDANRKQQVKQLANQYSEELEQILKIYPAQWYNYFDFWNAEE